MYNDKEGIVKGPVTHLIHCLGSEVEFLDAEVSSMLRLGIMSQGGSA